MRRWSILALIVAAFAVSSVVPSTPPKAEAAAAAKPTVVLVHGFMSDPVPFLFMQWDLMWRGYNVYALKLPANGQHAGDTEINAKYVQSFIQQHKLSNVILGGHSLGGVLVEYYVRLLNKGEVTGRFTLDSTVEGPGDRGLFCWFVPDQCRRSTVRNKIFAANPRDDIPFLNITSFGYNLPQVDCEISFKAEHITYPMQLTVRKAVITFVEGGDPCKK